MDWPHCSGPAVVVTILIASSVSCGSSDETPLQAAGGSSAVNDSGISDAAGAGGGSQGGTAGQAGGGGSAGHAGGTAGAGAGGEAGSGTGGAAGATGPGIPFGFWDGSVNPIDPPGSWTGAALADSNPTSLLKQLAACKSLGIKAWFRLTGSPSKFKDPTTGHLDTALWKTTLDPHKAYASEYLPYIQDGTFQGNIMLDDLTNEDLWGGQVPTWQEIEEIAQYSKQVIPGLLTAVRAVPSYLLSIKGSAYEHLDTAWAQYSERKGDVVEYRDTEVQAAKSAGLGLVVGLQLLDGGAKTQDCWPGYSDGMCAMKPAEITAFGSVLAAEPSACGMLLWHVDHDYLARPGVLDAILGVASIAAKRGAPSCAIP